MFKKTKKFKQLQSTSQKDSNFKMKLRSRLPRSKTLTQFRSKSIFEILTMLCCRARTTKTSKSYVSKLESQLKEEKSVRMRLEQEIQEMRRVNEEI